MHFCMDEVRTIVSAVSDPHLLLVHIAMWFRGIKARLAAACRRCYHCPEEDDAA